MENVLSTGGGGLPITPGWGPAGKKGAVSFTFDNLGEASDIEFGKWPKDHPVGLPDGYSPNSWRDKS